MVNIESCHVNTYMFKDLFANINVVCLLCLQNYIACITHYGDRLGCKNAIINVVIMGMRKMGLVLPSCGIIFSRILFTTVITSKSGTGTQRCFNLKILTTLQNQMTSNMDTMGYFRFRVGFVRKRPGDKKNNNLPDLVITSL